MSRRQQNLEIYKIGFAKHVLKAAEPLYLQDDFHLSAILYLCWLQVLVSTVLSVSEEVSSSRSQVSHWCYLNMKIIRTQLETLYAFFLFFISSWIPIRLKTFSAGWKMQRTTGMLLQTIMLRGDRFEHNIECHYFACRPFERGISELSAATGRSDQCRMSQTDQQVFPYTHTLKQEFTLRNGTMDVVL